MDEEPNDDRPEFITFSLPADLAEELGRTARRLAYPRLEPLCVELVRLGLEALADRYEPLSRSDA